MVRTRRGVQAPPPAPVQPVPRQQRAQRQRQPPARLRAGAAVPMANQDNHPTNAPATNAIQQPPANINAQAPPSNGEALMQLLNKQQAQINSLSDLFTSKFAENGATTSTVSAATASPISQLGQLSVVESNNIQESFPKLPFQNILAINRG